MELELMALRPSLENRHGRLAVWSLSVSALLAIALSILLWGVVDGSARAPISSNSINIERVSSLILFGLAGCLGAILRSFAYFLAIKSFTPREYSQWRLEAAVGPGLGLVAGLGSYIAVSAFLVGPNGEVDTSGMYLLALVVGAGALTTFGRFVERGILRSGLSRTGILGGPVSPSVPVLARLEGILEQRLADLSLVNYAGHVTIVVEDGGFRELQTLSISFDTDPPPPTLSTEDAGVSEAQLSIAGGVDSDWVNFTLSIVAESYSVAPLLLTMTAPARGRSEKGRFVLRRIEKAAEREHTSAILEVAQGNQTVAVVPLRLP